MLWRISRRAAVAGCLLWAAQAAADLRLTDRLIVKLKGGALASRAIRPELQGVSAAQAAALSALAGVALKPQGAAFGHIVKLPRRMALAEAGAIAAKISKSPDVAYAEPDQMRAPSRIPDDPYFAAQWNLQDPSAVPGAIDVPAAWDLTTGGPWVTVAVVDTGILGHADLAGRVLPGYDFVSDPVIANDGDGRDADPSDPGDWVSADEAAADGVLQGCPVANSSWHGTHVAGSIGAAANNGVGIAGIGWGSWVLPVRAMGKCGGYVSDIADGIRWAVGLAVAGVPANPMPAKVVNLSLGGTGACSTTEQEAIDAAVSAGAVVVVAAGNQAQDAANVAPANCNNVLVVAATDMAGARASYSDFGPIVDLAAPGGDSAYGGGAILSTGDGGATVPLHDDAYLSKQGTSMAASQVSGVAALMLSVNPALTPAALAQLLKSSARPFPSAVARPCKTSQCGAGIVDAAAAVIASAPALVPVPVSGIATGTLSSLSLQASIVPLPADAGKTVNLYLGARLAGQWYLRTPAGWVAWSGGALPAFASAVASPVIEFTAAQDVDASALIGSEIFAGYGVDDQDLLNNRKYGLIYTIK